MLSSSYKTKDYKYYFSNCARILLHLSKINIGIAQSCFRKFQIEPHKSPGPTSPATKQGSYTTKHYFD